MKKCSRLGEAGKRLDLGEREIRKYKNKRPNQRMPKWVLGYVRIRVS